MPLLEIRNLSKSYPDGWTLADVNFTIERGETLCLLGPSGCGKTTLLRLIAGLEHPDRGQILLDGEDVTYTPPHRRPFGLMFQDYALFPHKDVFGNVSFGLRMEGWERDAVHARVAEVLALVGLTGFERRDVNQLSGGERQRVALARSLAPQPRLLLLDEPLGALDRTLRERLLDELPAILRRAGVTAMTVTHDQEEAFAMADRVLVMRDGRVVQEGPPGRVYRHPASAWVARFLGLTNLVPARVAGKGRVETDLGELLVDQAGGDDPSRPVPLLLIRPESAQPGDGGINHVTGVVVKRTFRGSHFQLDIRFSSDVVLTFEWTTGHEIPQVGDRVGLVLDPAGLTLLEG
jgi:ABC-type Fe3+/spermidine/putrescine transport system ATPase subunit